jgi:hypothetical protein
MNWTFIFWIGVVTLFWIIVALIFKRMGMFEEDREILEWDRRRKRPGMPPYENPPQIPDKSKK